MTEIVISLLYYKLVGLLLQLYFIDKRLKSIIVNGIQWVFCKFESSVVGLGLIFSCRHSSVFIVSHAQCCICYT